jgi:hypothetical protein
MNEATHENGIKARKTFLAAGILTRRSKLPAINVRFTPEDFTRIRRLALTNKISFAEQVRRLCGCRV